MSQGRRPVKAKPQRMSADKMANTADLEINPDAHLFGLSGELRNEIYRYVLLEKKDIHITQFNHTEPALLQVCRQIRDEAKSIYREENDFRLHVDDYKPILPAYPYHWVWKTSLLSWWFTGRATGMSRDNLKAWMKMLHAGRPLDPAEEDASSPIRIVKIAARAANIVYTTRTLRWSDVETLLDDYMEGIAAADSSFWA